jgi:hypothetical protein
MTEWIKCSKKLEDKERILGLIEICPVRNCWNWKGSKKGNHALKQYGSLVIGSRSDGSRKTISAHRFSFQVFKGSIPENLWVLHHCDNPSCVNPQHLFLGTRNDNVDDRERKKRNKIPRLKAENHPNCKLSWDIVKKIRVFCKKRGDVTRFSKLYNINRRNVQDIATFKTWKIPPKDKS